MGMIFELDELDFEVFLGIMLVLVRLFVDFKGMEKVVVLLFLIEFVFDYVMINKGLYVKFNFVSVSNLVI